MVALAALIAFSLLASPLIAAAVFVVAFAGFLFWRGSRRAERDRETASSVSRVPTTEEASADPVRDSSLGDPPRNI